MGHKLLTKVRLTTFFISFFLVYTSLVVLLPKHKFDSGVLTLFSVNSFLYGFYISPILSAQKARIEELHRIIRSEANTIFSIVIFTKKLPAALRNQLQDMITTYLKHSTHNQRQAAERAYEQLITVCVDYKGHDQELVDRLLEKLVNNQQNRTMLSMQINNRVYNNEWVIMLVLFSITLTFILLLDTGSGGWLVRAVTALLCTGLSMLLMILVKLNTLTHKKAREIWEPFQTLIATHYYRIDQ